MTTDFASLGLAPALLTAIDQLGYTTPTPIQAAALPPALAGADVLGQAETGSGKTAAFGLTALQRLTDARHPQALVLCPTRELAEQVADAVRQLAQRRADTRVLVLCGGRPIRPQRLALDQGAQVVVGTPGRVADLLRSGDFDPTGVRTLVLDEADRLLDMGFVDEVQGIVDRCPPDRQTLLFSATFPDAIAALSARIQRDPVRVSVSSTVASDRLRQLVFHLEPDGNRHAQIAALLAEHAQQDDASALLFCETRVDCDRLARFLSQRGAAALALHGRLEQRERDDVLVQFANGSCRLLVATDVAARGLDIPALPLVIVTEVSPIPENHVHRIGRTGRAGEPGLALTVVRGPVEAQRLAAVEALLGAPIPVGPPVTAEPRLAFLASTNQTVVLLRGRKHKLRKGDVLGALVKDAKLPADAIGRIDLADTTCAIAIRRDVVVQALRFFQRSRVKNKRMPVVLLGE